MKKFFTIFFCCSCLTVSATAQEQEKAEHISARLLYGHKIEAGAPQAGFALDVALTPEWYTYWRMPGDSGLAPVFDWKDSKNVKDVKIEWPTPDRFTTADMHSFGYKDAVVFPILITPENPSAGMTLDLLMDFVVCHDICVPQRLHVLRTVAADEKPSSEGTALLRAAQENLPLKENTQKIGMESAVLGKDAVVVAAYAKKGFAPDADLMIVTPNSLLSAPPEIILDEKDKTRALLKIKAPAGMDLAKELFGKTTAIIFINGDSAVEKNFTF